MAGITSAEAALDDDGFLDPGDTELLGFSVPMYEMLAQVSGAPPIPSLYNLPIAAPALSSAIFLSKLQEEGSGVVSDPLAAGRSPGVRGISEASTATPSPCRSVSTPLSISPSTAASSRGDTAEHAGGIQEDRCKPRC